LKLKMRAIVSIGFPKTDYRPPTQREKLEASAESPLRPSKGQKPLPKSGLFGR